MDITARSALSTNTKKGWGRQIALIALRIPLLRLVAPQLLFVNVTLDGLAGTVTARVAWVAHTKPATGLLRALVVQLAHIPTRQLPAVSVVPLARTRTTTDLGVSRVRNTHTLRPRVTTSHPVSATLAGRAKMVTAQAVWVAVIRPATGLLRALFVQQVHIPKRQLPAVSVVQRARTRQKTDHSVSCVRNTHTLRPAVTT